MPRALLVVDVQNDFCEGGSLAVAGGAGVAGRITDFLRAHRDDYALVVASRDWHEPMSDNGGHFGDPPDFRASWPAHCLAGTPGADYHPALDVSLVDVHVRKGSGRPAYSMFEGTDADGDRLSDLLEQAGVETVDVVGLATDYCVLQTALDAVGAGLKVTVRDALCAGVTPETTRAALETLSSRGATVVDAGRVGADGSVGEGSGQADLADR